MPNNQRKSVAFRAHLETGDTRTETFQGREYLVVPVIALVEGVLQAMNAPTPELALASEFGKVPESWNGRPIVMNHPIIDNSPVSANSPSVLEEYQFGYMFNTVLEDSKLKTEAWLDVARVAELGGEVESTVARIQSGEDVEVSTGLFCATEPTKGRFNSREYKAIWRNVLPDHLAFLSEGVLGACSGEDGCGVRANTQAAQGWGEFIMPRIKDNASKPALKVESTATVDEVEAKDASLEDANTEIVVTPEVLAATDCGCDGKPVIITNGAKSEGEAEFKDFEASFDAFRMTDNAAPADMVDSDVRKLLSQAVRSVATYEGYAYIIQFTSEKVIYEVYDRYTSYDYVYLQRSYDISDEGAVTLGADVERVNLLTRVVPYQDHSTSTGTSVTANSSSTGEPAMPDNKTQTDPAANTPADQVVETKNNAAGTTTTEPKVEDAAPKNNSAPTTPKVRTAAEFIAEAPAEMQEMLASGLKLHAEKKNGLIKALKDSGRCKFDDAYLNGQSLETLQNMAELASVPSYEGTAPAVRDNAGGGDGSEMYAPQAPRMNFGKSNDNAAA